MTAPLDQIAFVAGIIEGEGTITASRSSTGRGWYLIVKVGMTDEDVIRRCHEITGLGNVTGPHRYGTRPANKPVTLWTVGRADQALTLIGAIWPYLGERRREQCRDALGKWRAAPPAYSAQRTKSAISQSSFGRSAR